MPDAQGRCRVDAGSKVPVDAAAFGGNAMQVVVAVGYRGDGQAVSVHLFPHAGGVGGGEAGHVQVGGLMDVLAADRPGRHLQCLVSGLGLDS